MDKSSTFYDYKVFIKKNLKIIAASTVGLLVVMLFAVAFFILRPENEVVVGEEYVTEQLLPQIESAADVDELSKIDQDILADYFNKGSYSFRIYVETNEAEVFKDNELLMQILLDNKLVDEISDNTNSEFIPNKEFAVSVFRISGSEMLQIKVATGNPEYNQTIAEAYHQYIKEGNIDIFENKSVYFIDSEPIVFEEQHGITKSEELTDLTSLQKIRSNIEIILIVILFGALAGIILGTLISIMKETVSKTIPSIYNFDMYQNVPIVNLDVISSGSYNMDAISIQSILSDNLKNRLILSEKNLKPEFTQKILDYAGTSDHKIKFNVSNIESVRLTEVEEIVILVEIYDTSKQWFEKQMEQLKAFQTPVRIIRLPIDSDIYEER